MKVLRFAKFNAIDIKHTLLLATISEHCRNIHISGKCEKLFLHLKKLTNIIPLFLSLPLIYLLYFKLLAHSCNTFKYHIGSKC
jgi:hypothetical protein